MEWIGQAYLFKDKMYFIDNVDHRMTPHHKFDINSDGIRSLDEAEDINEEDFNILFLGDSFVFGLRLKYEDSVGEQLERLVRESKPDLKVNLINFGWTSSSPLLSYRLLKDIGEKYKPDAVIFGLDMSDFHDDLKYAALFDRQGIYWVINYLPITFLAVKKVIGKVEFLSGLHENLFGFPSQRFFSTNRPLSKNVNQFNALRRNIEKIAVYSKTELEVPFYLILFPRNFQHSDREAPLSWERDQYEALGPYTLTPFEYFDNIQSELDFPVISLLSDFQKSGKFPLCLEDDPHWNRDGAAVAAKAIHLKCSAMGCFTSRAQVTTQAP
jgi:hypothetical protein